MGGQRWSWTNDLPHPRRCNMGVIRPATYPRQTKAVPDWFAIKPPKDPLSLHPAPSDVGGNPYAEQGFLTKPLTRLELVTSPLPRECSTAELQGHVEGGPGWI